MNATEQQALTVPQKPPIQVLLPNPNGDRDRWKALREGKLSASRLASALGYDERRSPLECWEQVRGLAPEDPLLQNERVEAGMILEPAIAAWYELRSGNRYEESPGLLQHRVHEWCCATPDGWVFDRKVKAWGCLEIKNVDSMFIGNWAPQPPISYIVQIQVTMDCMGVDFGDFAVCFGGNKLMIFRQHRNEPLLQELYKAGATWHDEHIVRGVPPALTTSEGAQRVWKRLHPKDNGGTIQADAAAEDAAAVYVNNGAVISALEKEREAAKCTIIASMGDNTFLRLVDGSGFSYKMQTRNVEPQPARVDEFRKLTKVKKV